MVFDDMRRWVRLHDLVMNRVKVINGVTGDACTVSGHGGRYTMRLYGRKILEWRAYDLSSVEDALLVSTAVFDALWDARRLGSDAFALG